MDRPFQSTESFLTNLENQLQCTTEFVPNASKQLFVLIVFITAESMSCIHIKEEMLGVNENSACILIFDGMNW